MHKIKLPDHMVLKREDLKSDEEYEFYLWLLEAHEFGFVSDFRYEPKKFELFSEITCDREKLMKTKITKEPNVHLFDNRSDDDGITYTPDFIFCLTTKGMVHFFDNVFWQSCQMNKRGLLNVVHVDVKGSYNPHGDNRGFFLKQRQMYARYGIYVHKINPRVFFKRTWSPKLLRWMKNRREPTLTKLGRSTLDSKEYANKHAWRTTAYENLLSLDKLL